MRLMACEVMSLYLLSTTCSIECIKSTSNSTRALALELDLLFFKSLPLVCYSGSSNLDTAYNDL